MEVEEPEVEYWEKIKNINENDNKKKHINLLIKMSF